MAACDAESAASAPPTVDAPHGAAAPPPRLGRALFASYVQAAISLLLAFVTTPLYLGFLGTESYGLWATASSALAYLALSGLGFPQATANRIAEAYGRGQLEMAGRLVVTAAWMTLVLGLFAAAVFAVPIGAGVLTPSLFKGSEAVRSAALPVLLVVGGGYLCTQPLEQFRGALRSCQRVALEQVVSTLQRIVAFGLGLAALLAGGGVIVLAATQSAAGLCAGVVFCVLFIRGLPQAHVRMAAFSPRLAHELLAPSLHFVLISLSGALIWGTDNLVIASFLGTAAVTPYAVSMRVLTMGTSILAVGLNVLHPSTTLLWTTGREDGQLARRQLLVTRTITAVVALIVVEHVLLGREFIELWAGSEAVAPAPVYFVLVAIFALRSFAQSFEVLVVATSRHHSYAYATLAEGILNAALSLALVRSFGLLGVALGTLVAHMCASGWFLPWKGMCLSGLAARTVLARAVAPLIAPALAAALAIWGLGHLLAPGAWWWWMLRAVAGAAVYLALYTAFALDARERTTLMKTLTRRWLGENVNAI